MQIARVIGDVTATQKHSSQDGQTLLLVQPLDLNGQAMGNPVAAVDGVRAGVGDRVLVVYDGFAAFTVAGLKKAPLDTAVIAIIDRVDL
jgi:microcompartment protein CcmK/EutM